MGTAGRVVAGWIVGIVAVTALAVVAIMWAAGIGIFAAHVDAAVAKRTAAPRVTKAIYDTQNVISNVERFHNECNDIVAKNEQIQALASRWRTLDAAAQNGTDAFGQKAQASADALNDLTAARSQRANEAQAYNSQSAQYTRAPFKDESLPYRIGPPNGIPYDNVNCG